MSHNITVEGGTSVRLPTAGKYCDRDIVVKSTGGGTDTSDATAVAEDIMKDKTAYVGSGKVTGTLPNNGNVSGEFNGINETSYDIPAGYTVGGTVSLTDDIPNEVATQEELIDQIITALDGKAGGASLKMEIGTFTLTENVDEFTVTGLPFKPNLLIVNGGTLGVVGPVRTSYWLVNRYLGETVTYVYRNAASATTTNVFTDRYCVLNDDGFTVKKYLENPIIAGTYNWVAITDEANEPTDEIPES